jgi:hypothetical protein
MGITTAGRVFVAQMIRDVCARERIGAGLLFHCNGWPNDHPGQRPYDAK